MSSTKLARSLIVSTLILFAGCTKPAAAPETPEPETPGDPKPDPMDNPQPSRPTCVGEFPEGCLANCAEPIPPGRRCTCRIANCEATEVECRCDAGCFPDANGNVPADCDIQTGPDGTNAGGELGDALGECASKLSCEEENDLTTELKCSVSDCEVVQPQQISVDPASPSASPNAPSIMPQPMPGSSPVGETIERQASSVDVLFVVDNSASMGDDQVSAACAIDSFFGAVDAAGGRFRAGVLTTDLIGDDPTGQSNMAAASYPCTRSGASMSCNRAPGLVGLEGSCPTAISCQCPAPNASPNVECTFNDSGTWIDSADPAGRDTLRKLIVQGELGSWYENGLEAAFQYFAALERAGTFDGSTPTELVIIADEDADARGPNGAYMCPFNAVNRNTAGIPNFNPPAPTNGAGTAACKQDLINFYGYYFSSRNIVVHGMTYTTSCGGTNTEAIGEIYQGVIQATGGRATSICSCAAFPGFFADVGRDTAELSTAICLSGRPVDGTLEVTYTDRGTSEPVPESATDGWSYDAARNCVVLNGSWVDKFGSYRVDYYDQNAPPSEPVSRACLAAGTPIAQPVDVRCNGTSVPESATDGFRFDASSGCFTFRGSWADSACSTFTLNPVVCGLTLDDPAITEMFCGDQKIPRGDPGWSPVPGHADCAGLSGSWADAGCTITQTPMVCPNISGPPPVPETLALTCGGAEVPASRADGWYYESSNGCFYIYGTWATAACAWSVTYIPSNNSP